MAILVWDTVGERFYETGVKKGVLFPQDTDGTYPLGVAWNGLSGVTETPSGAEPSPIYADDVKYLNLISAEEFGATIEAYTYPDEFAECDGSVNLVDGVVIGQQKRTPFGLAYRTTLGNDVEGNDFGYKLHLIYGAFAAPSEKAFSTINDTPEAITFSWEVSTIPVDVTGEKPTALLTIDSTKVNAANLATLEDMIYGTAGADSYLPLPDAIATLFGAAAPSPVAISDSDPLDEDTNVPIDSTIEITFNNEIRLEGIVVTEDDGTIVAGTKSWDTTGKIFTFTPSSNLSVSTIYLVTIGGVVDIYNQALAASVINFTTASS